MSEVLFFDIKSVKKFKFKKLGLILIQNLNLKQEWNFERDSVSIILVIYTCVGNFVRQNSSIEKDVKNVCQKIIQYNRFYSTNAIRHITYFCYMQKSVFRCFIYNTGFSLQWTYLWRWFSSELYRNRWKIFRYGIWIVKYDWHFVRYYCSIFGWNINN